MTHIYHLSLRRADDERRQFVIEHDMITTEELLDDDFVKKVSDKYQCDVKLDYLGELITPQSDIILDSLTASYYDDAFIASKIDEWQKMKDEDFTHGN